jgi:hypothetical protein
VKRDRKERERRAKEERIGEGKKSEKREGEESETRAKGEHRNVICVSASKNHCTAGNAPRDLRLFVLRSPCHVGGVRGAGMHSTTRVNGFVDMQSEDIYTAAQKHCGMTCGGRYPHILRSRGV